MTLKFTEVPKDVCSQATQHVALMALGPVMATATVLMTQDVD